MRTGPALPTASPKTSVSEALFEMTGKGMGMVAIVDGEQRLLGVFTDGDLRRALAQIKDFQATAVSQFMTRTPVTIGPDELAVEAVRLMETERKNFLLVIDAEARLIGALNMHDLLVAKVV
jgi:FOG: CBS domain